jgi:hypothetical protein
MGEASKPEAQVLAEAFDRARKTREALDRETEALNKKIEEIEALLRNLRWGVRAWTRMSEDEDDNYTDLVWGKSGNMWRLLLEEGSEREPDRERVTLLADASRWQRQQAFTHLTDLVDAMSKGIATEAKHVREAVTQGDKFIETFNAARDVDRAMAHPPGPPDAPRSVPLVISTTTTVKGGGKK